MATKLITVGAIALIALSGCAGGAKRSADTSQVDAVLSSLANTSPTVVPPPTGVRAKVVTKVVTRVVTRVVTKVVTKIVTVAPPVTTHPVPSRSTQPQVHTVTGTFFMVADRNPSFPQNCLGYSQDGQGDITVGATVTVRSGSGQILGVGSLTTCKFTDKEGAQQSRSLTFSYRVGSVADTAFYTIEVTHRGQVSFSRTQLAAHGWRANLSL